MAADLDTSDFYEPDKLYEDPQVTLYADFRMDVRQDQETPESQPTYIQDIVTGKRRVLAMGRPRSPSPSSPPLSPVQRLSARRKYISTPRVASHRQRKRQTLATINKAMESEMISALPTRFEFVILHSELIVFRLQTLDDDFARLVKGESEWPPSELPDAKAIYADFYEACSSPHPFFPFLFITPVFIIMLKRPSYTQNDIKLTDLMPVEPPVSPVPAPDLIQWIANKGSYYPFSEATGLDIVEFHIHCTVMDSPFLKGGPTSF